MPFKPFDGSVAALNRHVTEASEEADEIKDSMCGPRHLLKSTSKGFQVNPV
jgi:hypothetical protein